MGCACRSSDKPQRIKQVDGNTQIKLTVVRHDNENPRFEVKTDTVFIDSVDLSKTKVDVYFCHQQFQIPYYMPTKSIYRDSIKDKECDWKIYPATVKCYEYDTKGRVIKMQVEGSGTMGSHTFIYDDSDKIIEMTDNSSDKYKMTYGRDGNLLRLTVNDGHFQQLEFYYDKK
jgi:hypothetical protein